MAEEPPHLRTVEHPEPSLELLGVHTSVERVEIIHCFIAGPQVGRRRIFPSTDRGVRLVGLFCLNPWEQRVESRLLETVESRSGPNRRYNCTA